MCAHCYLCPRRPLPGPTSTAITLPSGGGGRDPTLPLLPAGWPFSAEDRAKF